MFVNGRPWSEIVPVLRERLERTREEELDYGPPGAHCNRGRPLEARMTVAVDPYLIDWLDFLLRWLHVIAGIVWIGTSFYFVALDNHLHEPVRPEDAEAGIGGEAWEVHGGGFYLVQKFKVAPKTLPEPLYWFKWEAYTTWLSGFALMCVLYYVDANVNLVTVATSARRGASCSRSRCS